VAAGWSLFAFGGAYRWTRLPLIAGAAALLLAVRPRVFARGSRLLDSLLAAALAVGLLQLIPLPAAVRNEAAPTAAIVERQLRFDGGDPAGDARPLSLDPDGTREATLMAAALVALFWSARRVYADGGQRRTCRAIAVFGLVASTAAIVQHATAPALLYGLWRPVSANARPFSPFVNKNDLATWLIMAMPLTLGYAVARIASVGAAGARDVAAKLDARAVWLIDSLCAMAVALVDTLSRSGALGAFAAAVTLIWLSRERLARKGQATLAAALLLVALIAAAYVNTAALMLRVDETLTAGVGGRREIWAATAAMIRDFWRTGVGLGAYAPVMAVYQPPHLFAFNHAHSEYLQWLAEGGVALAAIAAAVMAAAIGGVVARVRADRTPVFWMRAGAAAALVAVAVQSVWETGTRMPANGVLLVLCAAIALHDRAPGPGV
jgi:hypothetical protein